MIKHRKSGFFRIAAAILMICFTLFGLTACAGTTDSKDNNDDNALIQGTWEIDTGSGAGYKFVDDKFMWLKSIENVNDNYWYGDVEYYNGAEAMEIAGLTEEELKSSLPGLKPENIFVTKLDPEKIITDGEDKTATNMNDQTLWTRLWLIEENEDNVVAVVFDLETFSMESYTKVNYLILRNALMTRTVLNLNRSQLIILSILLTGIASVLAAVLSRQFSRPIFQIKRAVDKLTENDFSIGPDLERQDELGQLSQSVGKLRLALQRLDVLRREVIANVSHELRSPLALITGYAEMVRDITWKDDEMRNENLNLIISESNRMSEMVNDILDYSQFSAGYSKLKKDWYDLRDIVNAELTRCHQAAAEHGITLTLEAPDAPLNFEVDSLKMSQVMRNLLNNAINHSPENQEIFIRLIPKENNCLVEVANPGAPIPEEDRAIIWERYQRSQHQSGRRLGTGIGLSIVSTILKAHDMPYGVDCKDGYNIFWFICR